MNRRWILFLFAMIMSLSMSFSQPRGNFGIGFVFGDPTGFAWKYRLENTNSVDGVIGFSPFDRFRLHVDYLWESRPFSERNLSLHYGPGAVVGFGRTQYIVYNSGNGYFLRNEEVGFGLRGVIGITYLVKRTPLDVFFEIAPLIVFAPHTGSGIDLSFGGRFYP